jgi:hypothetical protein
VVKGGQEGSDAKPGEVRLKISAKSKKSFTFLFCHAVFQAELFKPAEFP